MAQQEILNYMTKKNESWFLSKDLVDQLNISRTAIIRGLTKLSEQGLLLRKPLKLRGFAYKINSKKTFN